MGMTEIPYGWISLGLFGLFVISVNIADPDNKKRFPWFIGGGTASLIVGIVCMIFSINGCMEHDMIESAQRQAKTQQTLKDKGCTVTELGPYAGMSNLVITECNGAVTTQKRTGGKNPTESSTVEIK